VPSQGQRCNVFTGNRQAGSVRVALVYRVLCLPAPADRLIPYWLRQVNNGSSRGGRLLRRAARSGWTRFPDSKGAVHVRSAHTIENIGTAECRLIMFEPKWPVWG
jgi:hypothetical protein